MELASKIRKDVGDVDVLINNAGIMPCKSVLMQTEQEIRLMNDINVNGNLWVSIINSPKKKDKDVIGTLLYVWSVKTAHVSDYPLLIHSNHNMLVTNS